jgi:hypothetical protein
LQSRRLEDVSAFLNYCDIRDARQVLADRVIVFHAVGTGVAFVSGMDRRCRRNAC